MFDRPQGFAFKVQNRPPGRFARGAGHQEDLAQVKVAVDTLQRPGFLPRQLRQKCFKLLLMGPDGGAGLSPRLADAPGYFGRDVLARNPFPAVPRVSASRSVHGGGRLAQLSGFGGKVGCPMPRRRRRAAKRPARPPGIRGLRRNLAEAVPWRPRGVRTSQVPVIHPRVEGTSLVPAEVRAAPTSTSGFLPTDSDPEDLHDRRGHAVVDDH